MIQGVWCQVLSQYYHVCEESTRTLSRLVLLIYSAKVGTEIFLGLLSQFRKFSRFAGSQIAIPNFLNYQLRKFQDVPVC
jgi:hypothetical protein